MRRQAGSRCFLLALILILPCVTFLVGLDLAYAYERSGGVILPWQFNLSEEGAIGEWFEYGLTFCAMVWLFQLWRLERAPAYFAGAAIFLWLTLDNSLALHEAVGAGLAPFLTGLAGDRAQELGELVDFGAVSIALLAMLWLTFRGSSMHARARMAGALLALVVGAGFGVAVDFLAHFISGGAGDLGLILDFVEDAGELSMLGLSVAFVAAIRFNPPALDAERPAELALSPS